MNRVTLDFEWRGKLVEAQGKVAIGRASVAWGTAVTMKAKARAHRLSGTLSRGLHCAPGDYETDETKQAEMSELAVVVGTVPKWEGEIASVAAGAWISYAKFEMDRGGAHDFLTAPVEEATRGYERMIRQAMQEARL